MNIRSYKCGCCGYNRANCNQVVSLSPLLKLISEESRLKILSLLSQGAHCVCEIMDHFEMSQSLISHHLADLKEMGLIKDERQGKRVYYSLTEKGKKIADLIFKLEV